MTSDNTNEPFIRIGILGVGGVGGYLAGMLAAAEQRVTLFPRSDYQTLRESGLKLITTKRQIVTNNIFVVDPNEKVMPPVDVLLLATKSYDLVESLQRVSGMHTKPLVVTLQNGVESDKIAAEKLPGCPIAVGVAYIVSRKVGSGDFLQSAGPCRFIFGDRNQCPDGRLVNLVNCMQSSGIDAVLSTDIERELWLKYIWILAFSGVTALYGSTIGAIMDSSEGCALFIESVNEATSVAQALGININEQDRDNIVKKGLEYRVTGRNATSSLASDIQNKSKVELEVLHTRFVRFLQTTGIKAPKMSYVSSELSLLCAGLNV